MRQRKKQAKIEVSQVDRILSQRATSHGDFTDNARVMQRLKDVVRAEPGYANLNYVHKEAIDMILHKIGRAVSGNANFADHWDDIGGYAKLVSDRV